MLKTNSVEKFRSPNFPKEGDDPGGFFVIPHPRKKGVSFCCIVSNSEGWEHVSINLRIFTKNGLNSKQVERCLTWPETCYIKQLFWEEEDCVLQYHPPKSKYVNNHPFVLHLWRPINQEIPQPPTWLV